MLINGMGGGGVGEDGWAFGEGDRWSMCVCSGGVKGRRDEDPRI